MDARHELKCARSQLHHARLELSAPIASPPHSRGYWKWKARQARRWIKQAHHRLEQQVTQRADQQRFVSNYGAASYWTHRYFGYGYAADLALCIAGRESHYTLGATHQNYPTSYGIDYGPWQINQPSHPWVNFYRIVRSWKYATAVAWHVSGGGTDFSPWGGRC